MTATPPTGPTSQVSPPVNNPPPQNFNPPVLPPPGPTNVSFTPSINTANNPSGGNGANVSPAALPDGAALATNNGLVYLPISQFDANQYSQFQLPGYEGQAGEAAVFTMIARGVDLQHASDYMIDTFWNARHAASASLESGEHTAGRQVTFSDGNGNNVAPTGGFPDRPAAPISPRC